ncbi:hypothetical protein KI387_027885 [Taxus chinensis]|uniref:Uncharacterized protein n=1 Tax=Taxus chinensis TaxID=29808 RepID=A0AA38FYI8_TAXCH|nr:hypothetical protein KI387_027885 [Taxus chinensis]
MGSVSISLPLLNEEKLQELINHEIAKIELVRRDLTRKYQEQIAELELAFRQKLYQLHLHTSSSQDEVLQAKVSKNLQRETKRSLDSGLLEQPGWCSLCEVDCNTEKNLKKHILLKNHPWTLQKPIQGLRDEERNSKQLKSLIELQQQKKHTINSFDKQEKQMKEGGIYGKKMQQDNSRSLDSGSPERPGWCLLSEVGCNTDKNLNDHILGKKLQSTLNLLKQGSADKGGGNSKQQKPLTELQQQDKDIIDNLDKQENQIKEGGMCSKKMQQDSSSSLDLGFPEQPGWCLLCEVECSSEKNLNEIHILGKKHQSKFKMLNQDSGFPEQTRWCSLCEVKCTGEKDLENHILGKKHQSKLKMLKQDSGFPEQSGCEVECTSEKDLENHSLGKKHQSKLKMLNQDSGFPEQPGWCSLCEVECPNEENLNELHISGKKHQLKLKMLNQVSGFPEKPGWCSLCEVECTNEKDLENHILGKKHQSKLKMLGEDSGFPEQSEYEVECTSEKDLENHILGKKHQSTLKMLQQDSGFPEQPGWCSLCEVECPSEENLNEFHISGKKHQSRLKMLNQVSGFPEKPGWCSLCEIECTNEKDLENHILGKKHQSKYKMLEQDSGFPEQSECEVECTSEKDLENHILGKKHQLKIKMLNRDLGFPEQPRWCSLCEVECPNEENLNEFHISGKKHQSKLKMLNQDSKFLEQPGWCSLCEFECTSEKDLENHILGKKRQSNLKMLKQESGEGISKQVKPKTDQEQQESDMIGNLDKREKQTKEGGIHITSHKLKTPLSSSQLTIEGFGVSICQIDFESHLSGSEHEMQLRRRDKSITLSEVKDDSSKCEITRGKELIKNECGLLVNDNVEKRVEKMLVGKINHDRDIGAKNDKMCMKENAELNVQQQIKGGGIPSEICKMSSNSNQIRKKLGIPDYGSLAKGSLDKTVGDKTVLDFKDDGYLHNKHLMGWQESPRQRCAVL